MTESVVKYGLSLTNTDRHLDEGEVASFGTAMDIDVYNLYTFWSSFQ
jgi:hypothetical protein